jgi:hypothetical protein
MHISQRVLCCSVYRLLFTEVRVLDIQKYYCNANHTADRLNTFALIKHFSLYFVKYAQYINVVAYFKTNCYLRF